MRFIDLWVYIALIFLKHYVSAVQSNTNTYIVGYYFYKSMTICIFQCIF